MATSAEGLKRVKPRAVQVFNSGGSLSGAGVLGVCEDATGAIWVGTYSGVLYRLGPDGPVQIFTEARGLVNACFYSIWPEVVFVNCQLRGRSRRVGLEVEWGVGFPPGVPG